MIRSRHLSPTPHLKAAPANCSCGSGEQGRPIFRRREHGLGIQPIADREALDIPVDEHDWRAS